MNVPFLQKMVVSRYSSTTLSNTNTSFVCALVEGVGTNPDRGCKKFVTAKMSFMEDHTAALLSIWIQVKIWGILTYRQNLVNPGAS